jgi:dephospho-CoA kinase
MNFVVGLTGGIGSGKSTVAELFKALGASIVDTDVIAHELTAAHGAAMPAIEAAFGTTVLRADGALDRDAMRQRVFADPSARKRLEGILHPLIRAQSELRCHAQLAPAYVLLVVPLLVESGIYRERVRRILVVDCDEAVQVARVVARSGLSAEQVRAIMATQATRSQRLAAADDVVDNGAGPEALQARVLALHQKYRGYAARLSNQNISCGGR